MQSNHDGARQINPIKSINCVVFRRVVVVSINFSFMKRRQAIQNIAVITGGLLALPSWAKGWNPQNLPALQQVLNPADQSTLSRIIEAIIPESGVPGAKSLGVPAFVETMLADCYNKEVRDNVENGLHAVEDVAQTKYTRSFADLPMPDQQTLLLAIEQGEESPLKECYKLIKGLTIQGYTSSEYVQTTYLEYEMAPGYFYGCVPVK